MADKVSKFGFVMLMLGISGKEMSEQLGMDSTLISKWKNSQRKLTLSSEHLERVAQYFLKTAYPPKDRQLYALLKNYDKSLDISSPGAVKACLCRWLCDYDTPVITGRKAESEIVSNPFVTQISVYSGGEGKRKAISEMLNFAQTLREPTEIVICDWENTIWRSSEHGFTEEVQKKIFEVICCGHKIKLLQDFSGDDSTIGANIRFWLPLFLTGGIEVFQTPEMHEGGIRRACYLVRGELVINSISYEKDKEDHHVIAADDARSVLFAESYLEGLLEVSSKVVEPISANRMDLLAETMAKTVEGPKQSYLATGLPLFTDIPEGILKEILMVNGIGNAQAASILENARTIAGAFERDMHYYNFTQILDLDLLEAALVQPYYIDYELSTALGKEIRISRKQYKEILAAMLKKLQKRARYHVVITPLSQIDVDDLPVKFYVRSGDCTLIWDMIKMPYAVLATELKITEHVEKAMDVLCERLPSKHLTADWAEKQLTRLIASVK